MEAAITLPKNIGGINFAELLKLVGLPSERERVAQKLSGSASEVVGTVISIVDDLVIGTIEKHTAEEFVSTRTEVFPKYFAAMRALGDLARIVVPKPKMERLVAESFSEMEADFRELGPSTFGTELCDRGIFTVWTLRKIHDLAQAIGTTTVPYKDNETDIKLARKYAIYAIWTRFHVDCLVKSMRARKPIYPDVTEPICDGLRAVVDSYAWIRQWVDHRVPTTSEPELAQIPWDEEDELLLLDSMHDIDVEGDAI
jgi:hypothetical protein